MGDHPRMRKRIHEWKSLIRLILENSWTVASIPATQTCGFGQLGEKAGLTPGGYNHCTYQYRLL